MPIPVSASRPGSSNSRNNNAVPPPRPTATSRRGRSRSPVAMMGGPPTAGVAGGGRIISSPPPSSSLPPSGPGVDPLGPGGMSSAAAAAAAAAAKAYASGGIRGWGKQDPSVGGTPGGPPPSDPYAHGPPPGYHGSGPPPSHHGHPPGAPTRPGRRHPSHPYPYESRGGGGNPSGWPHDDGYSGYPGGSNSNVPGGPRSSQPYQYDPYGRAGRGGPPSSSRGPPPPSGSGGVSPMGPPPPAQHSDQHDSRYGGHRHSSSSSSSRSPYDHPSSQQQQQGGPPPHPHDKGSASSISSPYRRDYDSRQGHPASRHSSASPHSSVPSNHHSVYPPPEYRDGRYSSSRSGDRGGPPPDHHLHSRHSRHGAVLSSGQRDRRSGPSGTPSPAQSGSHPRSSPASVGGGTSVMIGGPKPIHLPKTSTTRTSPTIESPKMSSIASNSPNSPVQRPSARPPIFRDRPSDDASKQPSTRGLGSESDLDDNNPKTSKHRKLLENEDSPHSLLLNMRTPTTSYEEPAEKAKLDGNKKEGTNRASRKDSEDDDNVTIPRNNSTSIYQQSPSAHPDDPLFETLRSNDFLKPNGSIDLAPSYNFLTASFDSLTDGPYFTLESTLGQTESFDFKRAESFGAGEPHLLQRNFSAQILAAGSTSGIGYSPVNSYGTGGGFRRTSPTGVGSAGSNILLGGGPDLHAPIDAFGDGRERENSSRADEMDSSMLRTYSTGAGAIEDSHLRMINVGSFGYSRSYGEPGSPAGGFYRPTRSPDIEHLGNESRDAVSQHQAPQFLQGYNRGGSQGPQGYESHPQNNHYRPGRESTGDGVDGGANIRPLSFYTLLCKYRAAFKGCTFLLPGLRAAVQDCMSKGEDDIDESKRRKWTDKSGSYGDGPEPTTQDSAIARRRVESSICAFGGSVNRGTTPTTPEDKNSGIDAIFREKESKTVPPVTPSSTEASSKSRSEHSLSRTEYEDKLSKRYYENESRLSWSFEEEPPIEVPEHTSAMPTEPYKEKIDDDDDDDDDRFEAVETNNKEEDIDKASIHDKPVHADSTGEKEAQTEVKEKTTASDSKIELYCTPIATEDFDGRSQSPISGKSRGTNSSPQSKIKYRCKLCGQPKQNHRCPYQQSLARSIGVIVFPAVNAFIADEPGTIAAPLSEMNNFFDIQKQESQMAGDASIGGASAEVSPDRGMIVGAPGIVGGGGSVQGSATATNMVSPDSLRSSNNPGRSSSSHQSSYRNGPSPSHHRSSSDVHSSSGTKKRGFSEMNGAGTGAVPAVTEDGAMPQQSDLLFVEAMELKPEQFRVVSQGSAKTLRSADAFKYPDLPLPFAQRKRLSDNLYSLSHEVPELTDECAVVLREARHKNMWDLAVAELMTQVIIVLHCAPADNRLDGLRHYLLTLGIAC